MWSYGSILQGNAGKQYYGFIVTCNHLYVIQLRSADEGSTIFYTVRRTSFAASNHLQMSSLLFSALNVNSAGVSTIRVQKHAFMHNHRILQRGVYCKPGPASSLTTRIHQLSRRALRHRIHQGCWQVRRRRPLGWEWCLLAVCRRGEESAWVGRVR